MKVEEAVQLQEEDVEGHHEEEVEQPQVGEDVGEDEYHNEGTVCHINI